MFRVAATAVLAATTLALSACATDPIRAEHDRALQHAVTESAQREIEASAGDRPEPHTLRRDVEDLGFSPERLRELNEMGGPDAYAGVPLIIQPNLLDESSDEAPISLERAVALAIERNLDLQRARLAPAISGAAVVEAEARFDWVFFSAVDWSDINEQRLAPVVGGVPVSSRININQNVALTTGVRRPLTSGGVFEVRHGYTYADNSTPGINIFPDPSHATFVDLGLTQPLLRGFGTDVNLAEVRLARNLERANVEQLRADLMRVITETERAYWNLVRSRASLHIFQRLLERGVETRDVLRGRLEFDVRPAEFSDAVARVERRRADVIRAQNRLRLASDALKAILNDPRFPVGGETLLVPVDVPVDAPIAFSLVDMVSAAIRHRPEVRRAILSIDDASIRQQVADNARLPMLDLGVRIRFSGLNETVGDSYSDLTDGDYVNYVLGLAFEQPIGNRAAEARVRARRLERVRAVVEHRAAVQGAVLAVKAALRDIHTNYQLIEQTRVSRLAAAENLRTLLVEEQTLRALTPDFLDLKLRRQEALALAEIEEIVALLDYNTALADLYEATGATLERNRVSFVVPDAGELLRRPVDRADAPGE